MTGGAPAVSRAAAVLKLLARHPGRWWSLSEIARRLAIGKSSAHGLLATMVAEGLLLQEPVERRYTLGPALIGIGEAAATTGHAGLARLAHEEIRRLAETFDAQATTSCIVGDDMLIVDAAGGPDVLGRVTQIGERVPLRPPMGTVFLAFAPPDTVDRLLSGHPAGDDPSTRRAFARALQAVRARGFSASLGGRVDVDGDLNGALALPYHIDLLAAPVRDASGQAVLALSLFGFPAPLDRVGVDRAGRALCEAAERVAARIGGSQ